MNFNKRSFLFILVFLAFIIISCSNKIQSQESGYIKMHYYGDSNKPQPVIEFYIEGSLSNPLIDTLIREFYIKSFIVSKSEFSAIAKVIESIEFERKAPLMEDNFAFLIIKDTAKSVYYAYQRKQVETILKKLEEIIKDLPNKDYISQSFQLSLSRIPMND